MKDIKIEHFTLGKNHRPFIIAEMSGNHNQSLERALAIVDAAAETGVDAIKIQTYTADTMTIKGALTIDDPNSLWFGKELHDLYQEAYTPWEWHKPIFDRARKKGLIPFSTPFDASSVDFLEDLGVSFYKIASFENIDIPLLKKVANTGKPIIMSTGAATLSDIDLAVRTLKGNGCKDLVLLKCTSSYPASPKNSNIVTIPHLSQLFNCHTGLSDHTLGIGVAIASVALGARVIEKHFTLSRADGGVDAAFSMEVDEMKNLVNESKRAFEALGYIQYGIQKAEEKSMMFKRSVYVVEDIKKGDNFTPKNIRVIRPGYGIAPKYYELILEKKAKMDLQKATPLNWDKLL